VVPPELIEPARRPRGRAQIALAVLATAVLGGLIALGVWYRRDR
jgi:hypothetical protein